MSSPSEARLRSTCLALLILNLAFCGAALFFDALPGWKMFESIPRLDDRLHDRDQRVLHLRDYLPRGATLTSDGELLRVARWVCEKEPQRAPLTLLRGHDALVLAPGDCVPRAAGAPAPSAR